MIKLGDTIVRMDPYVGTRRGKVVINSRKKEAVVVEFEDGERMSLNYDEII